MLRDRQIEAEPAEARDEGVNGLAGILDFTIQPHAQRDAVDEEVERPAKVGWRFQGIGDSWRETPQRRLASRISLMIATIVGDMPLSQSHRCRARRSSLNRKYCYGLVIWFI